MKKIEIYQCSECGQTFSSYSDYERHVQWYVHKED